MKKQAPITLSSVSAMIFGIVGVSALSGAIFAGSKHQLFSALISGIVTAISIVEVRKEKTKQ